MTILEQTANLIQELKTQRKKPAILRLSDQDLARARTAAEMLGLRASTWSGRKPLTSIWGIAVDPTNANSHILTEDGLIFWLNGSNEQP